jgi:hypothetical protein
MKVTKDNFRNLLPKSIIEMVKYRDTQVTNDQKLDVLHQMDHVLKNVDHLLWCVNEGQDVKLCKNCGAMHANNYIKAVKERMDRLGFCFHCAYWVDQVEKFPTSSWLIINGHIYSDGGNKPGANSNDTPLGFAGHKWKIERDGKVWETNNLWSGSTIPQEHRAALPDNAKFVK